MNTVASMENTNPMTAEPVAFPASEVEASIRDFVRKDVASQRQRAPELLGMNVPVAERSPEVTVSNVNSLIECVAGASIIEIENLVLELTSLRNLLQSEGERVQREISGYAKLSQAAMQSTRMIAENVAQWKGTAEGFRNNYSSVNRTATACSPE